MRYIYFTLAGLLLLAGCNNNGIEPVKEVPVDIIPTKPCETLYPRITSLFPSNTDCTKHTPVLFSDTIQKKILLTRETEVYITFISEGAYYQNSFGWYEYNSSTVPQNTSQINKRILFPNVSAPPLVAGDKLQLGKQKFAAGTVISFFLIIEGWNNGTIKYNNPTQFTDPFLNEGGAQQHTLFKEKECGDIVLTFEDIPLSDTSNPLYDKDYEDIIFTVSDNKGDLETVSFETKGMVIL